MKNIKYNVFYYQTLSVQVINTDPFYKLFFMCLICFFLQHDDITRTTGHVISHWKHDSCF